METDQSREQNLEEEDQESNSLETEQDENGTYEDDRRVSFTFININRFNSFVNNNDPSGIPDYMKKVKLDSVSGNSNDQN